MNVTDNQLSVLVNVAYKQYKEKKENERGREVVEAFEHDFRTTLDNINQMLQDYHELLQQVFIERSTLQKIEVELNCLLLSNLPSLSSNMADDKKFVPVQEGDRVFHALNYHIRKRHNLIIDVNENSIKKILEEKILLASSGDFQKVITAILKDL